MEISIYWLIAAALLFALEAFGIPGIGFLFAGIGALAVGGSISLGLLAPEQLVLQFALFFFLTALVAVLLWRKLKTWRMNPAAGEYSNMIGTEATVASGGLEGNKTGEVHWSGTIMRARLADPALGLAEGTCVSITGVEGNILIVTPR